MSDRIKERRNDLGLTLEDIGKMVGVAKSTVRKWETGMIESIRADKIVKLATALNTTVEYLLDGTNGNAIYTTVKEQPQSRPVPVLKSKICGDSAFAAENIEDYSAVDARAIADCAVRCPDDSLICAHIFQNDLVFIQKHVRIENGAIMAIVYQKEIFLRRIYQYPNRIELRPENPLVPVIQIEGKEVNKVQVIGKAVAFLGQVR